MSIIQGNAFGGGSYEIAKSLRLRSSASAYLNRTPASASNRQKFTWSGWVKRGRVGSWQVIFAAGTIVSGGACDRDFVGFNNNDTLAVGVGYTGTGWSGLHTTTAVFRDPSAWYHIAVAVDTTNATSTDRCILYVNGVRQSVTVNTAYTLNYQGQVNNTVGHRFGSEMPDGFSGGAWNYFDGYLSEINFIDGQALDASYFGQVSAETGAWIPKKYTGTYGTNGFYLPFNDGSNLTNLTADRSGNGNNWTANNISLTSGVTYDWMDDTPTNNFAVLNPLVKRWSNNTATITEANLRTANVSVSSDFIFGSLIPVSGKWYFECLVSAVGGTAANFAVGVDSTAAQSLVFTDVVQYIATGQRSTAGAAAVAYGAAYTTNDVIGVALDRDAGQVTFYKNNVSQGSLALPSSAALTAFITPGTSGGAAIANFGQRPFAYTPPAGFKALCTKNLPAPSILNPKKHFDVTTYTGTGGAQTIGNLSFQPDLVWIKNRTAAANHALLDSVRPSGFALYPNLTDAEANNSTMFTGISGNSFSLAGSNPTYNAVNAYTSWLWKAGGAPVTNNAGSIQSQVSANTAAGFSIVTYTGTGANATVGHGLGVAPKFIVYKRRNAGADKWVVYHQSITNSQNGGIYLNTTNAWNADATLWNSTAPTSSVFSVGTYGSASAVTMVAYCFAEVPGFSKIGSYTGNGSSDGPFINCGFRPRWIMIKRTDTTGSWAILDTAREIENPEDYALYPNLPDAETWMSAGGLDVTSNGFKLRGTDTNANANGGTYIFMTFAEAPFNYANAR